MGLDSVSAICGISQVKTTHLWSDTLKCIDSAMGTLTVVGNNNVQVMATVLFHIKQCSAAAMRDCNPTK